MNFFANGMSGDLGSNAQKHAELVRQSGVVPVLMITVKVLRSKQRFAIQIYVYQIGDLGKKVVAVRNVDMVKKSALEIVRAIFAVTKILKKLTVMKKTVKNGLVSLIPTMPTLYEII